MPIEDPFEKDPLLHEHNVAAVAGGVEGFEQVGGGVPGDAVAVIGHRDPRQPGLRVAAIGHGHPAVRAAMVEGVADQIVHHLYQLAAVEAHFQALVAVLQAQPLAGDAALVPTGGDLLQARCRPQEGQAKGPDLKFTSYKTLLHNQSPRNVVTAGRNFSGRACERM